MAIKIIKPGTLVPMCVEYNGTCKNCNCQVICDSEEDLMNDGFYYYIHCPTEGCRCSIVMSKVVYRPDDGRTCST
jgi:hypothetical protein